MTAEIVQIPVGPMENFAYLIVDAATRKAAVVDPGWEPDTILNVAKEKGVQLDKVILTHTHFDHIQELPALCAKASLPVWVHDLEKEALTGVEVHGYKEGDQIPVGDLMVEILHTPGHTPGGSCLKVGTHLITGDTLFVGAIGRTDLPGSDPHQMAQSLKRLAALPDDMVIYPGHHYGEAPTSTIGREKQKNPYIQMALQGKLR